MSFDGNISENWRRWIQQFKLYMCAGEKDKKPEKLQCALLLHCAGEQAQELYNTFTFADGEVDGIEPLIKKFADYCTPRKNTTYERHVFNNRIQRPDETFDQFLTDLRILSKNCEYDHLMDGIIRDRIIEGIKNNDTRRRLLREDRLTLERCIAVCRATECTQQQMLSFTGAEECNTPMVHAVTQSAQAARVPAQTGRERGATAKRMGQMRRRDDTYERDNVTDCLYCGQTHVRRRCPAYRKTCTNCKKMNHFAKVCKSKKIDELQEDSGSDDNTDLHINAVTSKTEENAWHVDVDIKGTNVRFKIDTAAQANVIPKRLVRKIKKSYSFHIQNSKRRLSGYGGNRIPVTGKCSLPCTHRGKTHMCEFSIVELTSAEPILGLKDCVKLNLVKLIRSVEMTDSSHAYMEEYHDVFNGLGCLKEPYHIQINPEAAPVIHAPRKIPVTLTDRLKKELQRMEKMKVIAKVDKPTEWVNSMITVEKPNGSLRTCLDPKELNAAIKRQHFHIPTTEEIMSKLAGATHFSTLDASCGYWQIPLTEDSSYLTTFNTPFGRYRYLRLPFGINSAQEVFHKRISQMFEDIEGVVTYIDDLLIYASDKKEHDRRLRQVLERARKIDLRFNKEKSKIGISEVKYLGHILSREGIKPDPSKVRAIMEMETPEDKPALERFLGMVAYLSKFIPHLSTLTEPLRELKQKEVAWHWNERHEEAMNNIKETLVSRAQTSLIYYDVKQPVKLSVDASKSGLGAVLMQNDTAVAYASAALTKAQVNYAQIEKEMLAIVFGCLKFHQFIYGKMTEVETDHKPLVSIFKKPIGGASPRIQRLLLKLQPYQLNVVYKPGKEMYVADTLSRAHLKDTDEDSEPGEKLEEEVEAQIHLIMSQLPVSENKMETIRKETQRDATLSALRTVVKQGWPVERKGCSGEIREYWNYREELCEIDDIMMKGDKIIIPQALRREMLKQIHAGHFGIEKCKLRARELLFWPGMTKDIERVVSKCDVCQTHRNTQQKETLMPHETPQRPWQILGTDLFSWHGKDHLIVTDYYSRYWEVAQLPDTKSATVVNFTKSILARHGIPEEIKSDNGPQYSREYKKFSQDWNFKHTTVSPRHAQSNGLVEKSVQIVKRILNKADMDGSDPYVGFLEYRNTPIGNCGSPAQMLMGRRLKSFIPCLERHLLPRIHKTTEEVCREIETQKRRQKTLYDRTGRDLAVLHKGDQVRVQDHGSGRWHPAVVKDIADTPRSYVLERCDGGLIRRNRRYILRDKERDSDEEQHTEETQQAPTRGSTEGLAATSGDLATVQHNGAGDLTGTMEPTCTRSGRMIKRPARYED